MSDQDQTKRGFALKDFVAAHPTEAATRIYRRRPEAAVRENAAPVVPVAEPVVVTSVTSGSSSWRSWDRDFSLSQILGAIDNPGTLCQRVAAVPGVDEAQKIWQAVGALPLFQSVLETEVRLRIARGDIRVMHLGRDQLLETAEQLVLLLSGKLVLGWFSAAVLAEELSFQELAGPAAPQSANRIFDWRVERGPLFKRAITNLAYFAEPDTAIVLSEALGPSPVAPLGMGADLVLALFSFTPVVAVSISLGCLESWKKEYPVFVSRLAQRLAPAQQSLRHTGAAPDTVTDFFTRHGLPVAKTLRVVDLDKCTGCRDCEDACAERYGVSRLHIAGPRLGPVALASCCRTCEDRRCIAVCGYDAIAYDPSLGEVRIFDSHCIGCSKCSLACPYGAIEMHDLASQPQLAARVAAQLRPDAAARPDVPPDREVTRRTRIASKCDHCQTTYGGQQACISACQKDALLELSPLDLFLSRPVKPAPTQHVVSAADTSSLIPIGALSRRKKQLVASWPLPERRLRMHWAWITALLGVALLTVEVQLRRTNPHSSFAGWLVKTVGMSAPRDWHGPHSSLGLLLGVLGTGFMLLAGLYTPFARILRLRRDASTRIQRPPAVAAQPVALRRIGRVVGALPFHAWAGLIGPLLILLHTEGRLVGYSDFGVLALWFALVTVAAGVLLRHAVAGLQGLVTQAQARLDTTNRKLGALSRTEVVELERLTRQAAWLQRQIRLWTAVQPAVRHLRHVHLPAAVLCGLLVLLHIATALQRF